MIAALAFVPKENVCNIGLFAKQVVDDFSPVAKFFEETYVRGVNAVGRKITFRWVLRREARLKNFSKTSTFEKIFQNGHV